MYFGWTTIITVTCKLIVAVSSIFQVFFESTSIFNKPAFWNFREGAFKNRFKRDVTVCIRATGICLSTSSLNWLKVAFIPNKIEINELTDRWNQADKRNVRETQWIVFLSVLLLIFCIFCCF